MLGSMGGRSSGGCWGGEYDEEGEEARSVVGKGRSSSREMMWPPREEEMSWTTEPRLGSSTLMITFMRGSIRVVPGAGVEAEAEAGGEGWMRERRAAVVARRAADERADAVVSVPKRCSDGSKVRVTRVLWMGKMN